MREISRQTYSLLDWLGDWGGLMDALFMVAQAFLSPFSALALKAKVAATFAKDRLAREDALQQSGNGRNSLSCAIFDKYRRPNKHRLLERSLSRVEKELDLVKLISRFKMLVLATLSTLSADQRKIVVARSKLVVGSESPSSSSDYNTAEDP